MKHVDRRRMLRAIRGEEEMADAVAAIGIETHEEHQSLTLDVPSDVPVVVPSVADIARGLLAMWARGGSDLQGWAQHVLALVDIDLVKVEDHPSGELILDGIWDAAAGNEIDDRALAAAREAVA